MELTEGTANTNRFKQVMEFRESRRQKRDRLRKKDPTQKIEVSERM